MNKVSRQYGKLVDLSGMAIFVLRLLVPLAMLMFPVRLLARTASKAQPLPIRALAPMTYLQMQREKDARSWATADSCSVHGYVYYDGIPVAGASVHIESQYGTLDTTTGNGGGGSYPDYSADLSSPPLLVSPGDSITVTASYNGRSASTAYEVAPGEQQVDVILVVLVSPLFGDGSDGDLTVTGTTTDLNPIRASASGMAGSNVLTILNVTGSGFQEDQIVMVHQTRGTEAGDWELNRVQNVSNDQLILKAPLLNTYVTDAGASRAQVFWLPQYRNVTVNVGAIASPTEWDGNSGGILAFFANEAVIIDGTIEANGFAGADAPTSALTTGGRFYGGQNDHVGQYGEQGEGVSDAAGTHSTASNGNGGGGGYESSDGGNNPGAGGGGGGNGTEGATGGKGSPGASIGGTGGSTSGSADLTTIVFGGGGGGGAAFTGDKGGNGGSGGGIIFFTGTAVKVTGAIQATGGDGGAGDNNTGCGQWGGGGGAGGSILIKAPTATVGAGLIAASGGEGGMNNGGAGGSGRIRIEYSDTLSGTTDPPASVQQRRFHIGPIVTIHTIYPDSAIQGQDTVVFRGSAVDNDEDGTSITQYVWRSDLDGLLSTQPIFSHTASSLSVGSHTIYLKARDDEGEWSEEISTTLTIMAGSPPNEDSYEPDDTCAQANGITTNGVSQYHTFHESGDEDWVQFEMTAGTTYIIQTSNVGPDADTELTLFDFCDQPPLASDENALGNDATLVWKCVQSGTYYVRVSDLTPNLYGDNAYYDLSVRIFNPDGFAVIAAGHDDELVSQSNINYATNQAYLTFLTSYPKDHIYYLNPEPDQDVDGNGLNDDIVGPTTASAVQDAIQVWAESHVGQGVPFYLYLIDHGNEDYVKADGDADLITAQDLDLWLDNLEATTGCDQVTVIIEACHSGSFIDVTTYGPEEISQINRVVVASTASDLLAYLSPWGALFSDTFFTSLGDNQSVWTSFLTARAAVIEVKGELQIPWLDDNGDAVANEQDGLLASGRGLGDFFGGSVPVIDWVTANVESGAIQAQIRDDVAVVTATAVIYPPSYQEPPPGGDTIPELDMPMVTLVPAGGDLFAATYDGFTEEGFYRIAVYASDNEQNHSLPKVHNALVGGYRIYLPLIAKH